MDKKIVRARPIKSNADSFGRSAVSIIIPYHGHFECVSKLVDSILRITVSNPYQICLVDDASPNRLESIEFGKDMANIIPETTDSIPQIIWTRSETQLGFSSALKKGLDFTQEQKILSPWVVFLHSDCLVVDPNWMIEMGKSLLRGRSQNIRMVSARSNNPGEGVHPKLQGSRNDLDREEADVVIEDGFLPLYCVMCHRQMFDYIGGFLKPYPYAMYEDEELSCRMRRYNFKQAISMNSWIYHEGGVTINTLLKIPKIKKIMTEDNRNRCISDLRSQLFF